MEEDDRARAARLCGAAEGLVARFELPTERLVEAQRRFVRAALSPGEGELADAAAHLVVERITEVAFPSAELARDQVRLDRVIATALRVMK